jgi:RES domain-containing protein
MKRIPMLLVALAALAAGTALAHHSEPLYDMKHPVTVTGVVSRVDWSNPHVYLYLTVSSEKSAPEDWSIELSAPHSLQHAGWTSTTVKPGDRITCTGGRSKSSARALRSATIQLPDGRKLKS